MAKPRIEGILAIIANGHSYAKHVRGLDPDPQYTGVNLFRETRLGPDLNITAKEDLQRYLSAFMTDPQTVGYAEPSNAGGYHFYNRRDRVYVVVNRQDEDFGTVFRFAEGTRRWDMQLRQARNDAQMRGGTLQEARAPKQIRRLLNRICEDVSASAHAQQRYHRQVRGLSFAPLPTQTATIAPSFTQAADQKKITAILSNHETSGFADPETGAQHYLEWTSGAVVSVAADGAQDLKTFDTPEDGLEHFSGLMDEFAARAGQMPDLVEGGAAGLEKTTPAPAAAALKR